MTLPSYTARNALILLVCTNAAFLALIGFDKVLHANVIAEWETLVGPVTRTLLPVELITVVGT